MKQFLILIIFLFVGQVFGQIPTFNKLVLDSIQEMPLKGGYVLTAAAPKKMRDAFKWNPASLEELLLDANSAQPSYCTTATYLVFYKTLQKYWLSSGRMPNKEVLALLKPNLENDGTRMWGRWNSNGPGTAKLFHDAGLGQNFDNINQALPGDFMKIYWNDQVGKKEKGHSVVFLGREKVNGTEMIKFWSSSTSTTGYGEKLIPSTDAVRYVFSRLENPEMIETIIHLPITDDFLASMLVKESSWAELRKVSGINF